MRDFADPVSGLHGRRHVALMVETSLVYGREVLNGIIRYLRSHQPWSVYFELRELGAAPPDWLRGWQGDGVICRPTNPQLAAMLRDRGIPAVNLNDVHEGLGLPTIQSDHRAIGALAAEHLLERGFRYFAFCGFSGHAWSDKRAAGFFERLNAISRPTYVSPWSGAGAGPWEVEQDRIRDWLRSLPKPVGLLACNDMRGQHVLDACQRAGLTVPEEIAVVGVDNDEILCELCSPPLTSIVPNAERVGYEAAALLDRLMAGEPARTADTLIPPVRIVARQSSDALAIEDPDIAAAVHYIRSRACEGIRVADVLRRVPVSRTILERRFRRYLGRSPQDEIRAVQIKRAVELLRETDLKLDGIARLVGFRHPEYFSVAFKREMGVAPGEYRRRAQAGV